MWIVEQRDPAGAWSIIRATVDDRVEAEELARLYKQHNPKLRFRYRPDYDDNDDESAPIEVSEEDA